MLDKISIVKKKLDAAIDQLCEVSWMFSERPGKDFVRNRKLPLREVISFLLAMEGGTLTKELLNHFGYSVKTASSSAFVQQRGKLNSSALPSLFDLFVQKTYSPKLYKGLRLIAADGSDIQIPRNPSHSDSYFPGTNGQSPYNLLHLDAMYDLLHHTYIDATVTGKHKFDERRSLCTMVDRSQWKDVLIIADRGYEGYNLMAHIQEKGWNFLIRVKDIGKKQCLSAALELPNTDSFDLPVDLALTRKCDKEAKQLFKDRNHFRFVPSTSTFDFLPKEHLRATQNVFYHLFFRIVRFKIADDAYETVVTNLSASDFPSEELKKLYNMRWGIETSFRHLKYTIGLLHFHAKKVEYIYQEIFARLIMYNFSELVTSHVIIQNAGCQHTYKASFSDAVLVCRQFFLGNVSPPDVEALIREFVSPIRPGRSRPRRMTAKHAVSFTYRIA